VKRWLSHPAFAVTTAVLTLVALAVWLVVLMKPRQAALQHSRDNPCRVIRFDMPGEKPVCGIKCSWRLGTYSGHSSMLRVSCSRMGKPITLTEED